LVFKKNEKAAGTMLSRPPDKKLIKGMAIEKYYKRISCLI